MNFNDMAWPSIDIFLKYCRLLPEYLPLLVLLMLWIVIIWSALISPKTKAISFQFFILFSFILTNIHDSCNWVFRERTKPFQQSTMFAEKPSLCIDKNVTVCWVSLMDESISQARFHFEISFEISYCYFNRLTMYSANGGVLYISDGSYSMNVSNSMFYNCTCSNNGGAIYFYSTNSSMKMICANKCSCKGADDFYGQFSYILASKENIVDYASLSLCSHIMAGEAPVLLHSGNQRVDNTNSSLNHGYQCSGIHISSPVTYQSAFCTFSNNKVSHSICLWFTYNTGTVSYSCVVHNNSPSFGIIYSYNGSPKIQYCVFDMNQNTLFCAVTGTFEVSHSFISLIGSLSSDVAVSIANNNSFTKKQTYHMVFFNSFYCNTDIVVGTIGETPIETVQRTYEDCLEFNHTSDLNELRSIFSFRFLSQIILLIV